jgi:hypothetical protein
LYPIEEYLDDFYNQYNPEHIEETFFSEIVAEGFSNELKIHERIKRMLFWILDISFPIIGSLTIRQRIWIYVNNFTDEHDQYEMDVTNKLSLKRLIESPDYIPESKHDNICDNEMVYLFKHNLRDFHISQENISTETLTALKDAADYAKKIIKEDTYEKYEITDLNQLLFLEIMSMIETDTKIKKCKNCEMYFVWTNSKKEYCDRIAKGEKVPCSEIGSKRTYQKKLEKNPALESYERAYSTHRERYKRKKMTQDNLRLWGDEAKEKLEQVEKGTLSLSDYKEWLKK